MSGAPVVDPQSWRFDYVRRVDQSAPTPARHPVVVVGAGPVGLSVAIDLAQQNVPVVLIDDGDRLAAGSRAICFAKRTLEVFDRLGCGQPMVDKGVSWNRGRVFFGDDEVYGFDLMTEPGQQRPPFVNLQQYYVEAFLVQRAAQLPLIDLRWQHALTGIDGVRAGNGGAGDNGPLRLTVSTPEGAYPLLADYLVACDGARSPTRQMLGLESSGRTFNDRFLIVDIRLDRPHPAERWFWFDPPFHRGQSVLLHVQPDGVWRIDFQLGAQADPQVEREPSRVVPRVRAMLDHAGIGDAEFTIEWASVYTFSCQRMPRFRQGRVLFAGDAAHCVSPFGARGANSGIQDAENLAWKLARVIDGRSPPSLLDTYADERERASDENILNSTRSTDFITPKTAVSRLFRDAVLELSRRHPFARTLVNSGRLSVPTVLSDSPLNSVDEASAAAQACALGAAAPDAPLRSAAGEPGWLLAQTASTGFTLLTYGVAEPPAPLAGIAKEAGAVQAAEVPALMIAGEPVRWLSVHRSAPSDRKDWHDVEGLVAKRFGLSDGGACLLRPDQHLCARWRAPTAGSIEQALRQACGLTQSAATAATGPRTPAGAL